MNILHRLCRDDRGATTVEIALVLPILIIFIYGIFIVGIMFQANAGMQHALGEGARMATLFPTPSNTDISIKMSNKLFGTANGNFTSYVVDGTGGNACNTTGTTGIKTLRVTYSMPLNFLFFSAPDLSMSRCKTVYLPS